jgi:hypothetical protein
MSSKDIGEEVKRHKEEISQEIGEGGGCVEAWNGLNNVREGEQSEQSRRAVIKILGGSAASVAGLAATGEDASAESTDNDRTLDPTEVTGAEARKSVASALRSDKLKALRREVSASEGLSINASDPQVIEVDDETGSSYHLVSLSVTGTPDLEGEVTSQDAVVTLSEDRKALFAKAVSVSQKSLADDEMLVFARSHDATKSGVQSETSKAKVETDPAGSTSGGFQTADSRSTGCFACQTVGDAVCAVGCSVGIAVICAGTAVANLAGGFACTVIAGTLCTILTATSERYVNAGCFGDLGIEWACYYADYCDEPT